MKPQPSSDPAALRRAAEARLKARPAAKAPHTEADARRLQQELEVHQIELEMQNEELRAAQAQLEAALENFTNLYDFAPVGYFTLTADGTIRQVNLAGAKFEGIERSRLVGRRFGQLVKEADRRVFGDKLAQVFATGDRQTCEISLVHEGLGPMTVRLDATLAPGGEECRVVLLDITGRKQAEVALRETEAKFRSIFDHSPVGIYQTTPQGTFLAANLAMARILGYASPEELIRERTDIGAQGYVMPEQREEFKRLQEAHGTVSDFEYEARRKDGSTAWVAESARAVRDAAGKVICYEGTFEDITDRKRAEQRQAAFAALGRRLNAANEPVEAARVIVGIADDLFGWDSCKVDFYEAQTDRSRSILTVDVVNGQRLELSPGLSDTVPSPRLRKVIANGALLILRQEPITLSPDSTPFGDKSRPSASIMAVPIREAGKIVGVLAIQSYRLNAYSNDDLAALQDLADHCAGALERIAAEAALRESERRFRAIFEQAPLGISEGEIATARFISANQRYADILGYSLEELPALTFKDYTLPEDLPQDLAAFQQLASGEVRTYSMEKRYRRKDGALIWANLTVSALAASGGKPLRCLAVIEDITARRHTEQRRAVFASLGRRLNAANDETTAARIIVDIADDLFGWDSSTLALYEARTGRCNSVLTMDVLNGRRQSVPLAYVNEPPSPRMRRAIEQGAELLLREEPLAMGPDEIPFGDTSRPSASLMIVPFKEGEQVMGVLSIQSYRLHAYTREDLDALQALADHCAGALERIRGRKELERQRNELELILDTVPGIIFYKDRQHRLVRVNEAHARSLGLPRSAIEGRTDSELGSPHEAAYIRDDDEVMRTGVPKMGIIEPQHIPGGGTRWLQTDKLPYRDEHGNIIGILGFALDITERRQAEEALREKEQLLSESQRIAHVGSWKTSLDGLSLWSEETYRIFGQPPGSFTPTREAFFELIVPEDRPAMQEWIQQCGAGAAPGELDFRTRSPDGSMRHLRGRGELVCDAENKPLYMAGTVQDITERRHADDLLRRQHALITAVVEGTSDAVFAKDLEGRYLIINTAGAQALGRPVEEILGRTDAEFVPEPTARRFHEADAAVIESGQTQTQEETGLMGGQFRSWQANKAPMRDADGRIIGVIGVSRDITERKQVETALKLSEQRLATLFRSSPAIICINTVTGSRIVEINDRYTEFFGWTRAEAVGRTVFELGIWADQAERAAVIEGFRRDGFVRDMEVRFRTRSGQVRDALLTMERIDLAGEAEPLLISMATDITERKLAEAEVVHLSGRLLRAQDEERRHMARELHDSTAQILAALAMNLAVMGRAAAPGHDHRALLAECESQVKRATAELRTFAYLLHPPALEALGLAQAIRDYAEGYAQRSGVRVRMDVPEDSKRLSADKELALFRVLQESLGNIHRHSGSATASILLTRDAEAVTLEVRDTGRGLDAEQLANLRRGHALVGVGIAGMRERLRLLGGRLEIEAALPGVRVRATLPLAEDEGDS